MEKNFFDFYHTAIAPITIEDCKSFCESPVYLAMRDSILGPIRHFRERQKQNMAIHYEQAFCVNRIVALHTNPPATTQQEDALL